MINLNIIKYKKLWLIISGGLVTLAVLAISFWGLKWGLDFTGGSLLELKFESKNPSVIEIKDNLQPLALSSLIIQPTNNNSFILRFQETSEEKHQEVIKNLDKLDKLEELRFESIGPSIGAELKSKSFWVFILVLAIIIIYIAVAFQKVSKPVASWKYGLAAIVGLLHDVLITVGVFAVLGKFFGAEINTTFVAAILTVLGYSVNDTIVVLDRTRENLPKSHTSFGETVNTSINQTLSRSINTTLTTLLALTAVLFFGGETIRDFILALLVGVFCGAYSSIFVASPLLVFMAKLKK